MFFHLWKKKIMFPLHKVSHLHMGEHKRTAILHIFFWHFFVLYFFFLKKKEVERLELAEI